MVSVADTAVMSMSVVRFAVAGEDRQEARVSAALAIAAAILARLLSLDRFLAADRAAQLLTSLLALPAGLSAQAAVLVMVAVPLALLCARAAELRAVVERALHELGFGARLSGQQASGRGAYVGAVEVQADAAPEFFEALLGEAGVCAGGAGQRADEALLDATRERFVRRRLRVCLEHRAHMVHLAAPLIGQVFSPGVTRPLS
jgi:hypothetical protein